MRAQHTACGCSERTNHSLRSTTHNPFVLPRLPCSARDALAISLAESKPRRRQAAAQPQHPLLGDAPTLRLMRTNTMGSARAPERECLAGWGWAALSWLAAARLLACLPAGTPLLRG